MAEHWLSAQETLDRIFNTMCSYTYSKNNSEKVGKSVQLNFRFFFFFLIKRVWVCESLSVTQIIFQHLLTRGLKRALNNLELEFQKVLNCPLCMLGIKPGPVASILSHWVISWAPCISHLTFKFKFFFGIKGEMGFWKSIPLATSC